jgi:hypothetical protein
MGQSRALRGVGSIPQIIGYTGDTMPFRLNQHILLFLYFIGRRKDEFTRVEKQKD